MGSIREIVRSESELLQNIQIEEEKYTQNNSESLIALSCKINNFLSNS